MTEYIDQITPTEFEETKGLEDWRTLGDGALAFFPTESFATSNRLVNAISELVGGDDRPPDVDIRPDGVTVRMLTVTTSFCGVTKQDAVMARRISTVARDLGLSSEHPHQGGALCLGRGLRQYLDRTG